MGNPDFRLADWTDEAANALEEEFKKVESAPARLESSCKNAALINELHPWLTEFGKLGTRGKQAIELARIYRSGKTMRCSGKNTYRIS